MSRVVAASSDAIGADRTRADGRSGFVTGLRRRHDRRPEESPYVTRAMLLWPRLDRARLRRCGDDPERIAEVIRRRTSQPLEAILAMLLRHSEALGPNGSMPVAVPVGPGPGKRSGLRVLRAIKIQPADDPEPVEYEDLRPA